MNSEETMSILGIHHIGVVMLHTINDDEVARVQAMTDRVLGS